MLFEPNAAGKRSFLDAPRQMSNLGTSHTVKEAFNLPHRDTSIKSFSVGNRGLECLIKRKRALSNEFDLVERFAQAGGVDMRLNWRSASSSCEWVAREMNLARDACVDTTVRRLADGLGSVLQGGGRP